MADARIARGTPAFRRTNLALFAAGFSIFLLMYCVQPLLPQFAREFHISATTSSLAVSLTTGCLALAMLVVGPLSEALGRKPLMLASLAAASALTMASALARTWPAFLLFRAAEGVAFAGLPAVTMAYISEEMHPLAIGLSMGIYVAGTALGGMAGRLLTAAIADAASWPVALAAVGGLAMAATLACSAGLPPSAHFKPRPFAVGGVVASYAAHLRDGVLAMLFAEGFLFMGAFVAVYNYIGFRLREPPYGLSQTAAGSLFVLYLVGMVSSPWAGALAGRIGRARTLAVGVGLMMGGVLLSALEPLPVVATGIGLLTAGFFAAHSVASSWIALRARDRKAQATSLYLFFYYLGASVTGAAGGVFWTADGWNGVVAFLVVLLAVGLILCRNLAAAEAPPPQRGLAAL